MFTEQLAQAVLADRSRERAAATQVRSLHPRRIRRAVVRSWLARLGRRRERPERLVLPARAGSPLLVPIPVRSTPRRGS
jgi:hypothetical protein